MLDERDKNGHFSIKNFLIRRALRIWPLYYLSILVGFFLVPILYSNFFKRSFPFEQIAMSLPWYLVFLGNWSVAFNGFLDSGSRTLAQLWAISLDQQVYFIWPLLLILGSSFKKLLVVNISVIIFSILTRIYLKGINIEHPGIYANTFAWLEAFALGGLAAQLFLYKKEFLSKVKYLFSGYFQILFVIFIIGFMYFATAENRLGIRNGVFGYSIISLYSSYLILNLIISPSKLSKFLENKVFSYLGKISYGLYIWHLLVLEILFFIIPSKNLLVPLLGLPLTILLGTISYKYFEKPFLKLKERF